MQSLIKFSRNHYAHYAVAILFLIGLGALFNSKQWWGYAAAALLVFAVASLIEVAASSNWEVESKLWRAGLGSWAFLMVFCPIMSIFFPQYPKRSTLDQRVDDLGTSIIAGAIVLVALGIIALRRKSN